MTAQKTEAEKALDVRAKELDEREKAIAAREKAVEAKAAPDTEEDLTPYPTQEQLNRANLGSYTTRESTAD